MSADYSLLPTPSGAAGGGASHHSASKLKRVQLFLKRRPFLTTFLSLAILLSVYVAVFPSHPARVTSAVSSSWKGKTTHSSSWDSSAGDDDDGWLSHIGVGGGKSGSGSSKSSYAVDKAKCEQLWKDEGLVVSAPIPAVAGGHVADTPSGPVDSTGDGFSLEDEIKGGKTRKQALEDMVARTKGYYVRDYPLWLGFNNIRYIIEASLLHAEMLDRTLVVPTHVVARACEFDKHTCEAFATMVNRGDAMQSDEWRDQPLEKQWAWLIPIELMMNIPHIRKTRSIMTVADYLLVHDIPASVEDVRGQWQRNGYHTTGARLEVIPNREYDSDVARVDRLPIEAHLLTEEEKRTPMAREIRKVLEGKTYTDWNEIQAHVGSGESDEELEKKLNEAGAYVLHTWQGSHGMEYVRTVTEPIRDVSVIENMRGWWDDYHKIDAEVLLLEGETHYQRKPGALRFTTPAAAQSFARIVLYDIVPPTLLGEMAEKLDLRMRDRVGGRMWRSAHMRRGDFVKHAWVMNADPYEHFNRIVKWMDIARQTLVEIHDSGYVLKYPVPEATASPEYLALDPPDKKDPFYLATDERNATFIQYYKDHGAILIQDLISPADRREMDAWPLVFTDVLGVLEQTMMARASTFYGHALSSVSGGAVNHRATLGKDPRTTVID